MRSAGLFDDVAFGVDVRCAVGDALGDHALGHTGRSDQRHTHEYRADDADDPCRCERERRIEGDTGDDRADDAAKCGGGNRNAGQLADITAAAIMMDGPIVAVQVPMP